MKKIGLIDYGCGNFRSVMNALNYLGASVSVHQNADKVKQADWLILPGVGTFQNACNSLRSSGLDLAIYEHIQRERPFLGICVGMQVLMEKGNEFGISDGLGYFKGTTEHLSVFNQEVVVPHIGWSQIDVNPESRFCKKGLVDEYFYFNHSYVCVPEKKEQTTGIMKNNKRACIIESNNIVGVQFHPEKSHLAGLKFISTFLDIC